MQRALYVAARLMVVVLSVVSPVVFQAQTPKSFSPPTIMTISSVSSGMCLEPMNNSMEKGAAIVQEPCTGSPQQIWVWAIPYGLNGSYLMNGLSGFCLDALGPTHNETPVQWTCANPESQIPMRNENWEAVGTSQDQGVLKSSISGDCLDTGGNSTPGFAMRIYSCNNSASEIWHFQSQTPPHRWRPRQSRSAAFWTECVSNQ